MWLVRNRPVGLALPSLLCRIRLLELVTAAFAHSEERTPLFDLVVPIRSVPWRSPHGARVPAHGWIAGAGKNVAW